MSTVGSAQYWLTGARVYFQQDADSVGTYPIFDFGRIEVVSPNVQTSDVTLEDADGGVLQIVDIGVSKITEEYTVKCSNMSPQMMALAFSAQAPAAFTQSATPVTAVPHTVALGGVTGKGSYLKLVSAAGVPVYGITAVGTVKDVTDGTTYVLNTDYTVVSLERGLLQITPASAISAGDVLHIGYTPRAITGNRLIQPMTQAIKIKGTMFCIWGQLNNTNQVVREVHVAMGPTGSAAFSATQFSSHDLKLTVLSQPQATVPAGRLLYWLGTLPTQS